MSLYVLALFAHVSGAIGIFAGLGAYIFGAAALRRAQRVEQVRILAALMSAAGTVVVGGIVVLGIAGFYMAITAWGIQATWIVVATISFLLLAPGGLLVIDPRVRAIAKQARDLPDGPLPPALARQVRAPVLGAGLNVYVAVLFGIVFLMTTKPAIGEAILAMVVATAIGLLASLPLWWSARRAGWRSAVPPKRA